MAIERDEKRRSAGGIPELPSRHTRGRSTEALAERVKDVTERYLEDAA